MKALNISIPAAIAGFFALLIGLAVTDVALAGGSSGCGCTPPLCCAPPSPPSPPIFPCCQPPSQTINIPGVEVNVGASVIVNAQVQAQASVLAGAQTNGSVFVGGGGYGGYWGPGPTGVIQNFAVGDQGVTKAAYEATRTKIKKVVIEAICIDDKIVPHPASQVAPDRDIDDAYEGEIYRCIAGTHMHVTIADFAGQISFDHGWTMDCDKGQALYHSKGGDIACRAQKPARDCNERSLLRRYGAGVKVLTMITTERYTAYREEATQSAATSSMSLDGGVGGVMY
ncbi:MAG TPA: hypothetical protein VJP88_04705 [Caulobacteraceae bacterium]|nr:hypothetical protein [Caulobacteraceae bacterium]